MRRFWRSVTFPTVVMLVVVTVFAAQATLVGVTAQADSIEVEAEQVVLDGLRAVRMSPDGTALAAVAQARDEAAICIVDLPAGTDRVCTPVEPHLSFSFLNIESIVWAPDSRAIAFSGLAAAHLRDSDIWVMDATTGDITNVTDDGYDAKIFPGVDPDRVTDNQAVYADTLPAWSPDSQSIAFVRTPVGGDSFEGTSLMRLDLHDDYSVAGAPIEIAEIDPELPFAAYHRMLWGPTGEHIYFTFANPDMRDERNGIWSASVDDGSLRQVTEPAPRDEQMILSQLSPDGTAALVIPLELLFGRLTAEATVHLLDLESGELEPLVAGDHEEDAANHVRVAAFSPDGEAILQGSISFGDWSPLTMRATESGDVVPVAIQDIPERIFGLTDLGGLDWASNGVVYLPLDTNSGLLFPRNLVQESAGGAIRNDVSSAVG